MAAEFHGLDLTCSPGSIIPEGSGYGDVAFQSCAIAGSVPGALTVSGDSYINAAFSYSYDNVWRDFGIMILFTIAFILLGAFFSEVIEWSENGAGGLEFKSSSASKAQQPTRKARDEEEKPVDGGAASSSPSSSITAPGNSNLDLAADSSTFTWKDLVFTIPYDGSTRKLLNGVSGYCAPGTMTALVGSSGAGKTTCEFLSFACIAHRI